MHKYQHNSSGVKSQSNEQRFVHQMELSFRQMIREYEIAHPHVKDRMRQLLIRWAILSRVTEQTYNVLLLEDANEMLAIQLEWSELRTHVPVRVATRPRPPVMAF